MNRDYTGIHKSYNKPELNPENEGHADGIIAMDEMRREQEAKDLARIEDGLALRRQAAMC